MATTERQRLIRRIHAGARAAGIEEDERRCIQARLTGKTSCADMTGPELRRVADEIGAQQRRTLPDGPYTKKMRALWISGWNLGVIQWPHDRALAAFVRRSTGLDSARWAVDPVHARAVIEGLKSLLAREAGVDWSSYSVARRPVEDPKRRVLEAQRRLLLQGGVPEDQDIMREPPWDAPDREMVDLLGQRGILIRDLKAREVSQ